MCRRALLSPPQIVEVQRVGLNVWPISRDLDVEYAHYTLGDEGVVDRRQPPAGGAVYASVCRRDQISSQPSRGGDSVPSKFSRQNDAELKVSYENLRKRVSREEPVPTAGGIQTIIKTLKTDKDKELDPRRVIDTSFFPGSRQGVSSIRLSAGVLEV